MPVQMESFQQAWDNLSGHGLDLTRASFEIGWELAHIAHAVSAAQGGEPADPAGQKATGAPGGTGVLGAGQDGPAAEPQDASASKASYEEILEVEDLSSMDDIQVRIARIAAALWYFRGNPSGEIPASTGLSVPDITMLQNAAAKSEGEVRPLLGAFHVQMVEACASLDGTTIATEPNSTAPAINGMKEAYEVGRLLAAIVLKGCNASDDDFKKLVCVRAATMSPQQESAAFRAHSLLGGLRGCFPSAAAYSVARHLEDWSDWANGGDSGGDLVDYDGGGFLLEEAQTALRGQGRVWRAILSGQTLARDYIVATSVTDAANRLFVSWAANATAIARSFLRTALARFFLAIGVIALLVFFGAFVVDLVTQGAGTSGAKNGLTITAILAAVASAAGIFHVSRTQVTSALADIWGMVQQPMVEAELLESIALSTRRLPSDTVGGASPPQTRTMAARLARARRGSLPDLPKKRALSRG